jgi:hypothetical protein
VKILLYILLSVLSLLIAYQDIKTRTINIVYPLLFFCLCLSFHFFIQEQSNQLFLNILFVLINLLGIILYYSLKEQKLTNPINTHLGLGDIIFFLSLTPFFEFKNFIKFFIGGLIFALIVFFIIKLFIQIRTVPLAGFMAIYLIIIIWLDYFTRFNLTFNSI